MDIVSYLHNSAVLPQLRGKLSLDADDVAGCEHLKYGRLAMRAADDWWCFLFIVNILLVKYVVRALN